MKEPDNSLLARFVKAAEEQNECARKIQIKKLSKRNMVKKERKPVEFGWQQGFAAGYYMCKPAGVSHHTLKAARKLSWLMR